MMVVMVIVAAVIARHTPPFTPRRTYQLHERLSRPWHSPEGRLAPAPGLQEEELPQGSSRTPPRGSASSLADQDELKATQRETNRLIKERLAQVQEEERKMKRINHLGFLRSKKSKDR